MNSKQVRDALKTVVEGVTIPAASQASRDDGFRYLGDLEEMRLDREFRLDLASPAAPSDRMTAGIYTQSDPRVCEWELSVGYVIANGVQDRACEDSDLISDELYKLHETTGIFSDAWTANTTDFIDGIMLIGWTVTVEYDRRA